MLEHVDHVTIAVREIELAVAQYTALLGAAPVWRGGQPELGTHAALFSLENALVELVSPDASAIEAEALRERMQAHGEGLSALALGCADAMATSDALRARGVRATRPQPGEARGADGRVRTYRTVELSARATRGLSVFAVERPDLEALRTHVPAADAPHALDHVVVRSASPEAAIALYRDGLGLRLALDREIRGRRMLFFRVGGVTLEVVHDAGLVDLDAFHGLAYRVRDVEAAHARLDALDLALDDVRDGVKPGTRVFGVRGATCGVPTLILSDAARP